MRRAAWFLVTALAVAATATQSTAVAAAEGDDLQRRGNIRIVSNDEFDAEHGVIAGSGTRRDPYVIAGWDVGRIEIKDTSKHVVIRDNRVTSRLVLDWIGGGVRVVNNDVNDLRVNQNVKRTGERTSGVIAHNRFGIVGQLRHWDGVFEHNQVGDESSCMNVPFFLCRGVNFDGFNGAKFRHNNIYGYVEVRLHGHHHSSGFDEHSHYHGSSHGDHVDHAKRFHRVWVTNNTIHSGDYYGLLYTDSNHAGNDRTAASEQNPALNEPHVHTTRVYLTNNEIYGAGIDVDIFNARDERHTGTRTGVMHIKGNEIYVQPREAKLDEAFRSKDGIAVSRATDVKLTIQGNTIDGSFAEEDAATPVRERFDYGAGIYLQTIDKATVRLYENSVSSRLYGIRASSMTDSVQWFIRGLKTSDVERDVYYDSSVRNDPNRKS